MMGRVKIDEPRIEQRHREIDVQPTAHSSGSRSRLTSATSGGVPS